MATPLRSNLRAFLGIAKLGRTRLGAFLQSITTAGVTGFTRATPPTTTYTRVDE